MFPKCELESILERKLKTCILDQGGASYGLGWPMAIGTITVTFYYIIATLEFGPKSKRERERDGGSRSPGGSEDDVGGSQRCVDGG